MTNFFAKAARNILKLTSTVGSSTWGHANEIALIHLVANVTEGAKGCGNGKPATILDLVNDLFEAMEMGGPQDVQESLGYLRSYCNDLIAEANQGAALPEAA